MPGPRGRIITGSRIPHFLALRDVKRRGRIGAVADSFPAVGREAQKPFVDASHRLAEIMQHELGLRFSGSAASSSGVAIRGLQSVTAPAVAIEISSISVADPNSLLPLAGSLATAVSHAVLAFRPPGSAEER